MNKNPKRLKKLLAEHMDRAAEAEMRIALGSLAEQFDRWREGALTTDALDQAVHAYHTGIVRAIWTRDTDADPEIALARAVVMGVITRDSLPPEVLSHISDLVAIFTRDTAAMH